MSVTFSRLMPALAVAGLLALSVAAFAHLGAPAPVAERPAPFNPLSEAEQADAIDIALASTAIDMQLGDRFEVIGASLRTDKADMMQARPPRLADVQLFDYSNNRALWIVVDLDARVVRDLVPVPDGYMPPVTGAEIQRAGALARDHPEVQARLVDHPGAHEIAQLWEPQDGACSEHRCVAVAFYELDNSWGFDFWVIVDLTDSLVVEVREPGEVSG